LDLQLELNKELKRLQEKYTECQEYTVEWMPCIKHERMPFNRNAELNGEVNKTEHKLMIYCSEYTEAMHCLRHEFFEAFFDVLVSPYVDLFNEMERGYQNAFMKTNYNIKESYIEKQVRREEAECSDSSNSQPSEKKVTKND
jgi:hypothetical protein